MVFNADNHPTRLEIIEQLYPYIEEQLQLGVFLNNITRHILGLFHGQAGARKFKRFLSEQAHKPGANLNTLKQAIDQMDG